MVFYGKLWLKTEIFGIIVLKIGKVKGFYVLFQIEKFRDKFLVEEKRNKNY